MVRDLGIEGATAEEEAKGWAACARMFGRGVESCKAALADGAEQEVGPRECLQKRAVPN